MGKPHREAKITAREADWLCCVLETFTNTQDRKADERIRQSCNLCGAGCWNNSALHCDHATDERHMDPSERAKGG